MVINLFYTGKQTAKLGLVVIPKDLKGKSKYEGRSDSSYLIKPGQNTVKIPLGDLISNSGQPMDLKDVQHFYLAADSKAFEAEKSFTIFIQEIYLLFP
jgi:hypothetical protein